MQLRVDNLEKQAFGEAAQLAGLSVSGWMRERLRESCKEELQASGKSVAFLSSRARPKNGNV
jgi:hypothetical protein